MNDTAPTLSPRQRLGRVALPLVPVLAYLALALPGLATTSLWLDEIMSLEFASEPSAIAVLERLRLDTHAPIFFLFAHALVSIFGASEWSGRLAAVLFGALTILALDHLAGELRWPSGRRFAAAMLLATSPFFLEFSREVRPYSTAAFFVTLSWYAFVRLLLRPRSRDMLMYGIALGGTVLSFYLGLLSFSGQAAVILMVRPGRRRLRYLAGGAALGALLGSTWIPALFAQIDNARERPQYVIAQYYPEGIALRDVVALVADSIVGMAQRTRWPGPASVLALAIATSALAGHVLFRDSRRRNRLPRAIALWGIAGPFAAFVALCLVTPIPLSRYLAPQAPLLTLFLAAGVLALLRTRHLRIAALVVAIAFQVASSIIYHRSMPRTDWRGVAHALVEAMADEDVVVAPNVTARSCLSISLRLAGREDLSDNIFDYALFRSLTPTGRLPSPSQRLWYLAAPDAPPLQLEGLLRVYDSPDARGYAGGLVLHTLTRKPG